MSKKLFFLSLFVLFPVFVFSERLPEITIFGKYKENRKDVSGSVDFVDSKLLGLQKPISLSEALRNIQGVYVRDEDGLGLRPNISFRGIDGNRSKKVLLLEDGSPIALAPYGANDAYYAPIAERIYEIEVRKGSSAILYGPQTIGGVVHFKTLPFSNSEKKKLYISLGDHQKQVYQFDYANAASDLDYVFSVIHKKGNAPRDHMPYVVTDILGKIKLETGQTSNLILKLHYHNQDAKVTYTGLNQAMYDTNPDQNAAPWDALLVDRLALGATHQYFGIPDMLITNTLYAYKTSRDWWRREVDNNLANPITFKEFDSTDPNQELNGGRNRLYHVFGYEPKVTYKNLIAGLRFHYEFEDNKLINNRQEATSRSGDTKKHEERSTEAFSAYIQNTFHPLKEWDVTPGLRVEHYRQYRDILKSDYSSKDISGRTQHETVFIPGLGTTYSYSDKGQLFAGVHRGFSPASFSDSISSSGEDKKLDAEKSWQYELGLREQFFDKLLQLETSLFYHFYENQIVNTSLSSGGVALDNAGRSESLGIEFLASSNALPLAGGWSIKPKFSTTLLEAKILENRVYEENNTAIVLPTKNTLPPYIPEFLAHIQLELNYKKLFILLDVNHIGKMKGYTFKSDQVGANYDSNGTPSGREGDIDAVTITDLALTYKENKNLHYFASIKNIFDKTYIASRRPNGIFPGPDRSIQFGVEMLW